MSDSQETFDVLDCPREIAMWAIHLPQLDEDGQPSEYTEWQDFDPDC